jgi:predicted metalloprotease
MAGDGVPSQSDRPSSPSFHGVKWKRTRSEHLDDLRGRGGGLPGLGGLGGKGIAVGGAGIGGLLLLLLTVVLGGGGGGGLGDVISQLPGAVPQAPSGQAGPGDVGAPPPSEEAQFVEFLTEDVQAVWADEFARADRQYTPARVNLFTAQVDTACGAATSAVGPFYCPADQEVYIDLDFFDELRSRFGAPGDFAQAYVIAHEIGHHVQNLLGVSDEVRQEEQEASSQEEANRWSVRLELQADCLAGVWAHSVYARGDLEPGDVQEGLTAAAAVGDDRIQEQAGMEVSPETWTHGSAEQRQHWFNRGYESGDSANCDTFAEG